MLPLVDMLDHGAGVSVRWHTGPGGDQDLHFVAQQSFEQVGWGLMGVPDAWVQPGASMHVYMHQCGVRVAWLRCDCAAGAMCIPGQNYNSMAAALER